jgi:hypothetical protein
MRKKPSLLALAALGLAVLPQNANAVEIEKMGTCSMGSIWNAELELEFKVFDLSFDVDTRMAGEKWNVTLSQNGKRVATQLIEANKDFDDSSAEFDWDVIRPDRKGKDTFKFRAVNQMSGEVCKATLSA